MESGDISHITLEQTLPEKRKKIKGEKTWIRGYSSVYWLLKHQILKKKKKDYFCEMLCQPTYS